MEEIKAIKTKILSNFNKLSFIEKSHSYYLDNNSLIPVSNKIKAFKPKFDTDTIATNYAKKHKKKVEDVKNEWSLKAKNACDLGTRVHKFGEDYFYNRSLTPSDGYEKAIVKFFNDLPDTIIPILCETKVYSESLQFAGTFDILFYCTERKALIIGDWKTNADLYKNFKNKRMLEPFDFLLDMPLSHYELQMSMYQIPLEDIGLSVINRFVIWLKPDGTYERIRTEDYTKHLRYYLTL